MILYMQTTNHLTDEMLNSWADGVVTADERSLICTHLEHCQVCRDELESLRAVKRLLSDLPEPPLSRSFQLTPEQACSAHAETDPVTRASENENQALATSNPGEVMRQGEADSSSNAVVINRTVALSALKRAAIAVVLTAVILTGIRSALNRVDRSLPIQ